MPAFAMQKQKSLYTIALADQKRLRKWGFVHSNNAPCKMPSLSSDEIQQSLNVNNADNDSQTINKWLIMVRLIKSSEGSLTTFDQLLADRTSCDFFCLLSKDGPLVPAIGLAAYYGKAAMVRKMIEAGVDINKTYNNTGLSTLQLAAASTTMTDGEKDSLIMYLVNKNADVTYETTERIRIIPDEEKQYIYPWKATDFIPANTLSGTITFLRVEEQVKENFRRTMSGNPQ